MKKFLIVVACLLIAVPLTYPAWRPLAKRNLWFLIATNVWQDSLRRIGWVSGQIGQRYALYPLDSRRIPQDIARAQEIYRNYIKYGGGISDCR
jgi:hypothetical protein